MDKMTPAINVVLGVSKRWQNEWDEDEPFVSMQDVQEGELGLIRGDDDDPFGYFGLVMYTAYPKELDVKYIYDLDSSVERVKKFLSVHGLDGPLSTHVFTTYV